MIQMLLYALLGLLAGALVNLCADQLPRWRKVRRTPFCPYCDEARPPWAWIGLVAYLALKPRCQYCGAPISWRHPIVELGAAGLFAFIWYRYAEGDQSALLVPYTIYSLLLLLMLVIDLEHKLILNVVIFPAWLLAIAGSLLHPSPYFWRLALMGGALGFGLLFLVYVLGELFVKIMGRVRGKPVNAVAFGFGDVRLGGFIGLVVGFPDILDALFLAILLGGLGGMIYWFVSAVIRRRYSLFTAIPYGPFLIAGGMFVLFRGS